jgi:hypothetical protein
VIDHGHPVLEGHRPVSHVQSLEAKPNYVGTCNGQILQHLERRALFHLRKRIDDLGHAQMEVSELGAARHLDIHAMAVRPADVPREASDRSVHLPTMSAKIGRHVERPKSSKGIDILDADLHGSPPCPMRVMIRWSPSGLKVCCFGKVDAVLIDNVAMRRVPRDRRYRFNVSATELFLLPALMRHGPTPPAFLAGTGEPEAGTVVWRSGTIPVHPMPAQPSSLVTP